MELAIIMALTLALGTLLFSRVHFHFSFNLTISRDSKFNSRLKTPPTGSREAKRRERAVTVPPAVRSISAESDILSALLNLGCEKGKAGQIARKAMGQGKDFDSQLTWALQNAA